MHQNLTKVIDTTIDYSYTIFVHETLQVHL